MKKIKYGWTLLMAAALAVAACEPIEDEELRNDFASVAPITQEELNAAISVDQPFENKDDAVEGDQYIVVKNNRASMAGCWHIKKGELDIRSGSDRDTIVCPSNGDWTVYFETVSEGKLMQSKPVQLKVTNVFDVWSTYLTGAKDKADRGAKKVWRFRECEKFVCFNGAYGYWKYHPVNKVSGNAWWGQTTLAKAGNQTMEFVFNGNGFTTYRKDGSVNKKGEYNFMHTSPDKKVMGELHLTAPVIGFEFNDVNIKNNGVYWILELDAKHLTVVVPRKFTGGVDWSDDCWVAYFEAAE